MTMLAPAESSRVPWAEVSIVLIGVFMGTLDSFVTIVASPAIQAGLHETSAQVQWTLAAYQLAYAASLISGGRLGDIHGRKRIFLVGLLLFIGASAVCGLAWSGTALAIARAAQGIGAGLMVPQAYATIAARVPLARRAAVFGVVAVVFGAGSAGGQLAGGLLVGADLFGSGWRAVFWINVPVGMLAALFAIRLLPEARAARPPRLDVAGAAVISAALLALITPLIEGQTYGWPLWCWASLGGSGLLFGLFTVIERSVAAGGGDPLVRGELLAQRAFVVGVALVLSVYGLIFSYYLVLTVALQDGLGLSPFAAGLVYAPAAVGSTAFGLVASRLIPRFGRRVLIAGAAILAAGYLATILALALSPAFTPGLIIPFLVWQSVGGGLLIAPSLGVVVAGIQPADAGLASGLLNTAQQVGGAIGVAAIGTVFFAIFRQHSSAAHVSAAHGLIAASACTASLAALAGMLVWALPRTTPTEVALRRRDLLPEIRKAFPLGRDQPIG